MMDKNKTNEQSKTTNKVSIVKENLAISKKVVETGKHVFSKTVQDRNITIDVNLLSDEYEVERIPVEQEIDTMPQTRIEGNRTIIPVLREVAVVTKKLVLSEEIVITKKVSAGTERISETVREEVFSHHFVKSKNETESSQHL